MGGFLRSGVAIRSEVSPHGRICTLFPLLRSVKRNPACEGTQSRAMCLLQPSWKASLTMAQPRRKGSETIENDVIDGDYLEQQDDILDEILGEFDSAGEIAYGVKVYRVPVRPDGTGVRGLKPEFLFEGDHSIVKGVQEYCRDTYGSGTFRCTIRANNKAWKQFDFRVFKPGALVPAILNANENNALTPIVDRLLTRLESLETRLSTVAPATPPDRIAEMKNMAELMVLLRPPPLPEPKNTMQDSLAMVTAILAISKEVGGGGDGGTMWDMLGKIAPSLMENAAKMIPQPRTDAPPQPEQPLPQIQSPNPPPQNQQNLSPLQIEIQSGAELFGIPPQMFARLRETVILLCRRARSENEPSGYVDLILDELDEIGGALQLPVSLAETLLARDDLFDTMMRAFPMMGPYGPWFSQLLDACRKEITADECASDCLETSTVGRSRGTNSHDTQDNAVADKAGEA